MDAAGVVRRRLASQFLTTPGPRKASDVVRALGAVQAQDYAGGKWALSQRARDVTSEEIERDLDEGRILRTHVLRPTWHFVAPEDIRWMLALTAPRVNAAMAFNARFLELTPAVFRRSNAALTKALAGGKHLTRPELGAILGRAGVIASGQRLAHLMMRAEQDAIVCSGPRRGKQFTYALMDERVRPAAALERDAALAEVTRRYFRTRGPATARDFAWWSGLTVADATRGIQIVGRELARVSMNDQDAWLTERPATRSKPSAHLLPNYDEFFIGYKDRSAIAQRLGSATLITGGSALIGHVVVVNGQLVGGWKRMPDPKGVVEVSLLGSLNSAEKTRVTIAARRFGAFLGVAAKVVWR